MRDDEKPHPGQWRIMQVDSGTPGLILAAAFALLGFVVAPLFTLATVPFGVAIACLLRFTGKNR